MTENAGNDSVRCNCACCEADDKALLKTDRHNCGKLPRTRRVPDPGAAYGTGDFRLFALRGTAGGSGRTGHPPFRGVRRCQFLSFFSTQPRGKHTIRVCLGTACYVRGGKQIVERLGQLLHVNVGDTTADRMFYF